MSDIQHNDNITRQYKVVAFRTLKCLQGIVSDIHGLDGVRYPHPLASLSADLIRLRSVMRDIRSHLGRKANAQKSFFERQHEESRIAFARWKSNSGFRQHWRFETLETPRSKPWSWHTRPNSQIKHVVINIPASWHLIPPRGLTHDGYKMVQMLWGRADYDHITVWNCQYYDMSDMTKVTHHVGYLAKNTAGIAIAPSFAEAVSRAKSRERRQVVKTILGDN